MTSADLSVRDAKSLGDLPWKEHFLFSDACGIYYDSTYSFGLGKVEV